MGLEVSHEASHPGYSALSIWPHLDVFVDTFEDRSAQLQLRVNFVDCGGPLNIKCAVVFRHGVLTIGFLPHFYVSDAVATLLNVGDLSGCVFRCAIKHSDGNHRRQIVGKPAGKENIETTVLVVSSVVHILGGMPGINRRSGIAGSLFAGILRHLDEIATSACRARSNMLNCIANTVADIV